MEAERQVDSDPEEGSGSDASCPGGCPARTTTVEHQRLPSCPGSTFRVLLKGKGRKGSPRTSYRIRRQLETGGATGRRAVQVSGACPGVLSEALTAFWACTTLVAQESPTSRWRTSRLTIFLHFTRASMEDDHAKKLGRLSKSNAGNGESGCVDLCAAG